MERKTQITIFAIVSIVALILCYYSGKAEKVANHAEQTNDAVTEETANWTIQDVVNEQENTSEFEYVGYFHEGLAEARKEIFGDYGYIDENGNIVIEFQYRDTNYFSEGVAAVSEDGEKYGYIDRQGNWVIEPILDSAVNFHDGKATVRVGVKHYEIDKEGNILKEVKFD